MEHFITVAIFTYPSEHAVLELLLQQEGIQYVFENSTMIGVMPFHSNAIGGIRLKVHPVDADTVRAHIQNLDTDNSMRIV